MTDKQLARIKKLGLTEADFLPKTETTSESPSDSYITDDLGNKYEQTIVDGNVTLKLIESHTGEMFL